MAVIEIEPGAEGQVLADEGPLAAVHHRGEPGLGVQDLEPAFAARAGVELERLAPQPVGHLLAGAPSDPGDERLLSPDEVEVGIRGHKPKSAQRAVEDGKVFGEFWLSRATQPRLGAAGVGERTRNVDNRCSTCGYGRRLRLRLSLTLRPLEAFATFRGAERRQDEHVGRR